MEKALVLFYSKTKVGKMKAYHIKINTSRSVLDWSHGMRYEADVLYFPEREVSVIYDSYEKKYYLRTNTKLERNLIDGKVTKYFERNLEFGPMPEMTDEEEKKWWVEIETLSRHIPESELSKKEIKEILKEGGKEYIRIGDGKDYSNFQKGDEPRFISELEVRDEEAEELLKLGKEYTELEKRFNRKAKTLMNKTIGRPRRRKRKWAT